MRARWDQRAHGRQRVRVGARRPSCEAPARRRARNGARRRTGEGEGRGEVGDGGDGEERTSGSVVGLYGEHNDGSIRTV
eukprot:8156020-Pyramimonas_sp.AAC.1